MNEPRDTADEALFTTLMDAAARSDQATLVALCQVNRERIIALLPSWRQLPKLVRSDPTAMKRWGNTLGAIATTMKQALGDARAIQILAAPVSGGASPFERWATRRDEALALGQAWDLAPAIALLEADLREMDTFTFSDDTPRLLTEGLLGQLLFHGGQVARAVPLLQRVYTRVARDEEADNEAIYASTLFDAARYLGDGTVAARWMTRRAAIADRRGDHDQAIRFRAHAARWPDGEPLLRVVLRTRQDGRDTLWELDEIPRLTKGLSYEGIFARGRPTLGLPGDLAGRSRAAGSRGDHTDALALAQAGARADALDPDCRYLMAFEHLLAGRIDEAIALQEAIEQLAPGWYDNRAWLALSRRLARSALPLDLVQLLHTLEEGRLSPEVLTERAERAIAQLPGVGKLHLAHGRALRMLHRKDDAKSTLRTGLDASGDDPHTESQIRLQLALLEDDVSARRALLIEVSAGASLLSSAFAQMLLARD